MSEPPPWYKFMDDVMSGKYKRPEDVIRALSDMPRTNSHESDESAPKTAKSTPTERLSRIAQAHTLEVAVGGLTSGLCVECYQNYPCPTYAWATNDQREFNATWDPADDDQSEGY